MPRLFYQQMAKPTANMKAGLWRRRGTRLRAGSRSSVRAHGNNKLKSWGLHDTYCKNPPRRSVMDTTFFISRFFSDFFQEARRKSPTSAEPVGISLNISSHQAAITAVTATGRHAFAYPCNPAFYIGRRLGKEGCFAVPYHVGRQVVVGSALGSASRSPGDPGRNAEYRSSILQDRTMYDTIYASSSHCYSTMVQGLSDAVPWKKCESLSGNGNFAVIRDARVGTKRRVSYRAEQRRWFRDYFTAHLPGSSLHPDPPPLKTTSANKDGANDRATTTVRIPLRSAKHHFGVTRGRGMRPYNEDNYQAGVINLPPFSRQSHEATTEEETLPGQEPAVFYFSVFDGHGGDAASLFLKDYLHRYIEETSKLMNPEEKPRPAASISTDTVEVEETDQEKQQRQKRKELQTDLVNSWKGTVGGYFRRFQPDFGGVKGCGHASGDGGVEAVLTYAFLKADLDFITNTRPWFLSEQEEPPQVRSPERTNPFKGGSTATVVLLSTSTPKPFWNPRQTCTLITAHLGDTRALLCRVSDGHAIPLTTNHHPGSPSESARLRRYATAFVSDAFGEERFGVLANTRSLGDVNQKRLGVSAEPELTVKEILPEEYSFLVLVSDGVSAVIGDQEICDVVKECRTPEEAGRELVEFVDEVGDVGDNATALVVRLGGWEKRAAGGDGWMSTKALREWRRDEVEVRGRRGRRM